jgi:aminoglycoside phosphotransferase (APT) family kinase protein
MSASDEQARVSEWLARQLPDVQAPVTLEPISLGRSNLTFLVTDAARRQFVLRRPPHGALQTSAHDVEREFKILSALTPTPVLVPAALAFCADASLLGAPFFVMEVAGGETVSDPNVAASLGADARHRLGLSAVDALWSLHTQDPGAVGLSDFVRPGSYVQRQLRRWGRQLSATRSVDTDPFWVIRDLLAQREPSAQRTALIHGDYKLGNLRADADGNVVSILDWELAAVGDPVADLGWLVASWAQPEDGGRWVVPPPTLAGGFPTRAALVERYVAASNADVADIDFYVAFAHWRWSCINAGTITRFTEGQMADKTIDIQALRDQIRWQLRAAHAILTDRAAYDDAPQVVNAVPTGRAGE